MTEEQRVLARIRKAHAYFAGLVRDYDTCIAITREPGRLERLKFERAHCNTAVWCLMDALDAGKQTRMEEMKGEV